MSALLHPSESARRRRGLVAYRTVRPDLVEVARAGEIVGYVELVGNVFVALRGSRYNLAVEIAQSLSAEVAHSALLVEE